MSAVRIAPAVPEDVDELAALLVDAVEGGASVGFLAGVTTAEAAAFWRAAPEAQTWVARVDERLVGCVQLHPARLPNGAHRADVAKLLVHRSARGRGVATALMAHAEREALVQGRWLLQLDTETGSPAHRLYRRLGWQELGTLPDHAVRPEGGLAPTTFLYRRLKERGSPATAASPRTDLGL
jgi:GNAT superfamily N-acetyltransferase